MDLNSDTKVSNTNFKLAQGSGDIGTYQVQVSFTVPEIPYNATSYMLSWYNSRINAEGPAFTFWLKIEPSIQISPTAVSPGTPVTITGNRFPANDEISVTLDGKAINGAIATNDKGSFSTRYTIPATIAGQHEIKAAVPDMSNVEAKANLSLVPRITMSPDSPQVGSSATISGQGFASRSEVAIDYDGTMVDKSPTTDDKGDFSYTFKVPPSSNSEHAVIATDKAGNKATLGSVQLESDAPTAPTPIKPTGQTFGWFGPSVVTFNWTEVSDPSGVSYTLEIGDNLSFFPLGQGMRKTGLTSTSILVNLKPGTYYWRVKAVDGAGNESPWTLSPYPFKVGAISITYLVLGAIILVLVIVLVVRAAFRRIREYY